MLTWVGKRPLHSVTPFPAQHVESFTVPSADRELTQNPETWKDWPIRYPQGGLLFHGDNKEVLAHLLANGFRGKVQLIYIDPPFDSGADYVRKVSLRGTKGSAKIAGESYSLGEQVQYTDIWTNDNYLQFMYERLLLLKSLLGENGSLFLHCDWKRTHLLRLLLDEVFGPEGFKNEVIRVKCNPKNSKRKAFGNIHDCILFYTNGNGEGRTWQPQREGIDSEDLERLFSNTDAKSQRKYTTVALHARGTRSPEKDSGKPWRGLKPPQGRHWAYLHSQLDQFDADGLIEWSSTGNPRLIRYADEKDGDLVQDIWTMKDPEEDEYPTEKPEDLLDRIIRGTTKQGDIVLDCFLGSGTTAAVAQKLGRRWMGCYINKGAVQTTANRIQTIIHDQIEKEKHALSRTTSLPGMEADGEEEEHKPVQLCFTIWRVNDYDLAIQHNEAVNLACEHIGVTRTLSDSFFDGTLGQKLVKIIPFGHPLSLTDLEDVRVKIESRPNDSRDVVVVCLGKELGVEAWLANWNRMRKQGNTPNKIEVIELRTDPKYGKFFAHKPAQVRVKVQRADGKLTIEVQDFISPSILERLQEQAGPLLAPKVTDWRAMVDSIMIDPTYDGKIFNIAMADVPGRKQDLVQGRYELSAPKGKTVVAVKVTDMLGEEVLVQQEV
ncbi:MAG: site-specific DNA-methyltransferase [Nitrospirales bacterium]|nr:site-specific DNA-methyltransferase [Nitrospirales bacterium]